MVDLLKKIYNSNEILSKETKGKILKHKRRLEYFVIFMPSMFILLGYLTNSIKIKDYTNFKLFHRFTQDFMFKVTFNIIPIIVIAVTLLILVASIYKPKIVRISWLTLLTFIVLSISIPNFKNNLFELIYQVSIVVENEKLLVNIMLLSSSMILILTKRFNRGLLRLTKNTIELLLISAIVYLELIGEYSMFFFLVNFVNLFINGIRFLSGVGDAFIITFLSLVFLSLYGKKLRAIIFFIKNKLSINKQLKVHQANSGSPENQTVEIVEVSNKVKMPLLSHDDLPAIAVVVPAFNESTTAPTTIDSLLNVDYNKDRFFIFVVSDGSTDNTIDILINKYKMYKTSMMSQKTGLIKHNEARAIYKSHKHKHLILINKPNGGKSDALNLGLEYLPVDVKYMSVIDADSIVDKYSFRIFATEAKKDDKIAALAGTILPIETKSKANLKSTLLTNIQLFDYLSSFHGERGALSLLNAVLIIPGAFGFFDRWTLLELGGYPRDVLAEDGILTVNLHRKANTTIKFIPEALSYTQVPSTFADLRKQRIRWFKGLTELLVLFRKTWRENGKLTLVFLDYLFIEWITPIMIPIGLCVLIINPAMLTYPIFKFFMLLAIITPILQGLLCMGMESSYRKVNWRKLAYLPLTILLSPLIVLWRNDALLDLGNRNWGFIKRY